MAIIGINFRPVLLSLITHNCSSLTQIGMYDSGLYRGFNSRRREISDYLPTQASYFAIISSKLSFSLVPGACYYFSWLSQFLAFAERSLVFKGIRFFPPLAYLFQTRAWYNTYITLLEFWAWI